MRATGLLALVFVLFLAGCYMPSSRERLPEAADHFRLTYSTVGYLPVNVTCELNALAGIETAAMEHTSSGVAVRVYSTNALATQGEELCDALSSIRREVGQYFSPMPFMEVVLRSEPPATGDWHGEMAGNRLRTTFYTDGKGIGREGSERTISPFLASQVLATMSECMEYCALYGDGIRLPANDREWRWFREGLCLWLSYKGIIDRFSGARPGMNSPLEYKYYWATLLGKELLEWREGKSGDKLYAAAAGVFFAADEATGSAFPYNLLRSMRGDSAQVSTLASEALGCDMLDFAVSIRRPIPELYPEFSANEMVVSDEFERSADAMTLQSGDVVLAVAGRSVGGLYELDRSLWSVSDGEDFTLTVRRGERTVDVHCLAMGWRHLLAKLNRGGR